MLILFLLAGTLGQQPDGSTQQLDFLRLSSKANKDSFGYGTFRFQYTRGFSTNLADAEKEVFARAFEEAGYYAFEGENGRYETVAEPTVLAAATTRTGELRSSSLIRSFRSLTDGKSTLVDTHFPDETGTRLNHGLIMSAGTGPFYGSGSFDFPLYLGDNGKGGDDYDLFKYLTAAKDGKAPGFELDMDSQLDAMKVARFVYPRKDGKGKYTYWVDIERGSVPLRILIHSNPTNTDTIHIFSDLEQVSNAGWLPRKRLRIIHNGQKAIVDRLVITDIDTQHKPKPSTFQLEFPEPIEVLDSPKKLAYPASKTWSLLKLPGRSSRGVRAVERYVPPPEMPGEAVATPLWVIVAAGVSILLLVFGSAILVGRRMRMVRGVR
jgi:hypothetical protein